MDGGQLGITGGSILRVLTVMKHRVQSGPDFLEQTGRQCVHEAKSQASGMEHSQSHQLQSKNSLISVTSAKAITASFKIIKSNR